MNIKHPCSLKRNMITMFIGDEKGPLNFINMDPWIGYFIRVLNGLIQPTRGIYFWSLNGIKIRVTLK